jgi:predicted methyltransferase
MLTTKYCVTGRWLPALIASFGLAWGVNGYTSPQWDNLQAVNEGYQQAVNSPIRTDEDRRADATRKPIEFLQFAQVRPGMLVMDIAAGEGNTTQLLALAVGSKGTVWAQGDQQRPALVKRLADHPQPNIVPVISSFEDPIPSDIPKLDLITIILNYHDIAYKPVDRSKLNQRLFDALKSGGHLVVIDHSAKPGSGVSAAKSLHRIDEKVVGEEFLKAGFQLEEESSFLHNPSDPRDQAFFKMKIPSDKFALRFVKP